MPLGAPPATAARIACAVTSAIRAAVAGDAPSGIYHLTAAGETSWHGYACRVIEAARAKGLPVKVAREAIAAVPSSEFPTPAARPKNSRLDTTKLRRTFGLVLPPWQDGVDRLLAEMLA